MIQIFEVTAPLGELDGDVALAALNKAMPRIRGDFPYLLNITMEHSPTGTLRLELRVTGRDRWNTPHRARLVASSLLRRVKVDASTATMELMRTVPSGRILNRGRVRSGVTPEDPS